MVHSGDLASRGIKTSGLELDLATLMGEKSKAVKSLTGGIAQLFKKNKIDVVRGHGSITGPNEVSVNTANGVEKINTKHILLATGSEVTPFPGIEVSGYLYFFNGDTRHYTKKICHSFVVCRSTKKLSCLVPVHYL